MPCVAHNILTDFQCTTPYVVWWCYHLQSRMDGCPRTIFPDFSQSVLRPEDVDFARTMPANSIKIENEMCIIKIN